MEGTRWQGLRPRKASSIRPSTICSMSWIEVRPRDHGVEAGQADQRLLRSARRGPARVRRPARRDPRAGKAAVHRAARDQRGTLQGGAARAAGIPSNPTGLQGPGSGRCGSSSGSARVSPLTSACELLRLLTESGHQVRVIPTPDSLRFVGERPGQRCLASRCAPAPGRTCTRCRTSASARPLISSSSPRPLPTCWRGRPRAWRRPADRNVLLTARCPVVYAPAMHTEMWQHPATRANAATLRQRGALVLEPAAGRLTGADTGPGRLPEPAELVPVARRVLARGAGRAVDRTWPGGGSWSPRAEPGRNSTRSASSATGHQGCRATRWPGLRRRAAPTSRWSAANTALDDPAGVQVVSVTSAERAAGRRRQGGRRRRRCRDGGGRG